MRKKNISITIPKPCSQTPSQMEQTGIGFFCSQCSTEVVDYRKWSDAELMKTLEARKQTKNCGIFRPDQLDRPLYHQPSGCSGFSNTWKTLSVLAGLSLSLPATTLQAQTAGDPIRIEIQGKAVAPLAETKQPATRYMAGMVVHGTNQRPIRNATVQFKEAGVSVQTDKHGIFKLFLPDDYSLPEVTISVSKARQNYNPEEIVLQAAALPAEGLIVSILRQSEEPEPIIAGTYYID